jgi:8-oxo-dGTP pyrophosphatase MutT (NUDIX family)
MHPPAPRIHLQHAFEAYAQVHRDEAATVALFRDFLADHPQCFERALEHGHFTGSAWLVSADGQRVLLTHHRKLGRWLQLGGHADGDPDLARVALREAEEESGLTPLTLGGEGIFDLDRHRIPARGVEPEHWHYDVRYVVRAGADERFAVSAESLALAWRPVIEVVADAEADDSVRRMAAKWLRRALSVER